MGWPSTRIASRSKSACAPSSRTTRPLTFTRPARIKVSAWRRLEMPARDKIFCRRSIGKETDLRKGSRVLGGSGTLRGAGSPLFLLVFSKDLPFHIAQVFQTYLEVLDSIFLLFVQDGDHFLDGLAVQQGILLYLLLGVFHDNALGTRLTLELLLELAKFLEGGQFLQALELEQLQEILGGPVQHGLAGFVFFPHDA